MPSPEFFWVMTDNPAALRVWLRVRGEGTSGRRVEPPENANEPQLFRRTIQNPRGVSMGSACTAPFSSMNS